MKKATITKEGKGKFVDEVQNIPDRIIGFPKFSKNQLKKFKKEIDNLKNYPTFGRMIKDYRQIYTLKKICQETGIDYLTIA